MRVGEFSVTIPEGNEQGSGHVTLRHGAQYVIQMLNNGPRRCDALVEVDGKPVGGFRLNAWGGLTLERPQHDDGRFTFYEAASAEGQKVGGAVAKDERGLIKVTFKPERQRPMACGQSCRSFESEEKTSGGVMRGAGPMSFSAPQNASPGVTGLTGKSNQSFYEVANLDYDPAMETVITLRLVVGEPEPRELTPVATRANPVPAAV